ncbi:MAG: hypothetical protein ACLQPD_12965 [Desulfomonilaceae bacterium]
MKIDLKQRALARQLSDNPIGGLKEARILLPHRSESTIQDWVKRGNAEASSVQEGRGRPIQFSFAQLVDLVKVDRWSALGLYARDYPGPNFTDKMEGEGNIREVFEYPEETDSDKIFPKTRSPQNAIAYYKFRKFNVLISIDLMRVLPSPSPKYDAKRFSAQTIKTRRSKVGMLYYNVTYFEFTENNLRKDVEVWSSGNAPGRDCTVCLISIPLIRDHVSRTLNV